MIGQQWLQITAMSVVVQMDHHFIVLSGVAHVVSCHDMLTCCCTTCCLYHLLAVLQLSSLGNSLVEA